jgi:Flp pilus assembly protein TadD
LIASSTEPGAPAGLFIRAVMERDAQLLAKLAAEHPAQTLYRLDFAMRGFAFGCPPFAFEHLVADSPALRKWVGWLVEQDLLLRRQLGWSQREGDLMVLRAAYSSGDLVLVVGAGASMAAKMPGWNELVIEMIDRALYEGSPAHHEALLNDFRARAQRGESMVTIGNSLHFVDEARYAELLREKLPPAPPAARERLQRARLVLESKSPDRSQALRDAGEAVSEVFGPSFSEHLRRQLFERTLYRTKLHPAIARMVRPREPDGLTPRVFAIITYNFDDLLETIIREQGQESTTYVSRSGEPVGLRAGKPLGHPERPSAVDVYHPHGFLPATRGTFAFVPLDDVDLVFSEAQYRVRYGAESSWTTRTQLAHFGNAYCLILGSSLEDEDAVAQLSASHERRPGWFCYAIMQLPKGSRKHPERISGSKLERLGAAHRKLGLRTLWISDHDEIPPLLDSISQVAYTRENHPGASCPTIPIELIDAGTKPEAANELGIVLARNGDPEGARKAFQRAIDTPGFAGAASAMRHLGLLLEGLGDAQGAVDSFLRAANSGDPNFGPMAANNLGAVLQRYGDVAGAKAVYQSIIASGHPRETPIARLNLGILLMSTGDIADAKGELRRAIDTPTFEPAPLAMARRTLGEILARETDAEGARAANNRAAPCESEQDGGDNT